MKADEVDGRIYYTIEHLADLLTIEQDGKILAVEQFKPGVVRLHVTFSGTAATVHYIYYCDEKLFQQFVQQAADAEEVRHEQKLARIAEWKQGWEAP